MLAVVAIAATALMAPSAFGQEPLMHDQNPQLQAGAEPGNNPCPAVVAHDNNVVEGGCRLHIAGTGIQFIGHLAGGMEVITSTCAIEFTARLDSAAEGFLTHVEMADSGGFECHRRPCGFLAVGDEGRPWGFYAKEVAAGDENLTVLLCVRDQNGNEAHCEVDFDLTQPADHRYTIASPAGGSPCHGAPREINGSWSVEGMLGMTGEGQAEQQVEINHT
ncbi:MAG TPA: hypothetical protein VEX36_12050 [Thermoleophilaceae bacterium]|nr:hypothetical protein [Thermoleophilaceae bacterium]